MSLFQRLTDRLYRPITVTRSNLAEMLRIDADKAHADFLQRDERNPTAVVITAQRHIREREVQLRKLADDVDQGTTNTEDAIAVRNELFPGHRPFELGE